MDDTTKILIGLIVSVVVLLIGQFIMAARATKEKLDDSNNQLVRKDISGLRLELVPRLDNLAEGQTTIRKKQEVFEETLDGFHEQLRERKEESFIKQRKIEELEKENRENKEKISNLTKSFEEYKHNVQMKELKGLTIPNEKFTKE